MKKITVSALVILVLFSSVVFPLTDTAAKDSDTLEGSSSTRIYLPLILHPGNRPPYEPSNPHPADASSVTDPGLELSWEGGDPDGDAVVYIVYFEAGDSTPDVYVTLRDETTYTPTGLVKDTLYYWQIIAIDEHNLKMPGPVWAFTTTSAGTLPNPFNKISPANGAAIQSTTLTLSWELSSEASSYAFSYCYDTINDNACTDWSRPVTTWPVDISGLRASTTYYWQVKATNGSGDTYANGSPTAYWRFTTGSGTIIPAEMIPIPAGSFQMGCDPDHNRIYSCYAAQLPLHTVTLDAYRIDKYEVTNAQYAQCVAAGNCAAPSSNSSNNRHSYYNNPTYANYPVVNVSWQDAFQYCTWAGKRLPSEAEWEKAARGTTLITYPWGDQTSDCTLANFYGCVGDTSAVGSFPAGASPYGVMDMAGNLWEWVNDWHQFDYYSVSPASNPPGPASGTSKVIRGGGFDSADISLSVAARDGEKPTTRGTRLGFRCAAPPGN